jgi:hypothetical protein
MRLSPALLIQKQLLTSYKDARRAADEGGMTRIGIHHDILMVGPLAFPAIRLAACALILPDATTCRDRGPESNDETCFSRRAVLFLIDFLSAELYFW